MKRNRIMKLALTGLLAFCGIANARNLFTPLTLRKDYLWYPFLECDDDCEEKCFDVKFWGAVFNRSATKTTSKDNFNTVDDGTQVCPNKDIAKLFTAKSPFYLNEVFENNTNGALNNPLINFAKVSPHLVYNETGVMFGFELNAFVPRCERWRWGIRGTIPFVNRKVEQLKCCADLISGDALADIIRTGVREPVGNEVIEDSFALRLDVLSALYNNGLNGTRFVEYGTGAASPTKMAGDVTILDDVAAAPSVHVIGSSDGSLPSLPFSATIATVTAATAMDGAGSNIGNASRGRFVEATDYTSLSTDGTAQAKLYVVPTLNDASDGVSEDGKKVVDNAESLLNSFDADVDSFLAANGITFDSQTVQGAGNLDLEAYLNYQFCCCALYLEGRVGLVLPTDTTIKNPGNVYQVPTGNDGHVEVDLGLAAGWNMCEWAKLYGDISYHWVLSSSENVAGAFKNAKVKNVGPKTQADVDWRYTLAHVDLTIIPPCLKCIGFDLGYQFYWKQKDNVKFCKSSIADLAGVTKTLNSCVLEKMTKVISHKLSFELFSVNTCADFFGGFSYVVAGKSVMREAEWHVGMAIKF